MNFLKHIAPVQGYKGIEENWSDSFSRQNPQAHEVSQIEKLKTLNKWITLSYCLLFWFLSFLTFRKHGSMLFWFHQISLYWIPTVDVIFSDCQHRLSLTLVFVRLGNAFSSRCYPELQVLHFWRWWTALLERLLSLNFPSFHALGHRYLLATFVRGNNCLLTDWLFHYTHVQ